MKDADPVAHAATGTTAPTDSCATDGRPANATVDVTFTRMASSARTLRLSRELRLRVSVDATGWLRDEVEIVYQREPDSTITPFAARVGRDAIYSDLRGPGGIGARCRQYNAGLRWLQQLAARLAGLGHRGPVPLARGSAFAVAHDELSQVKTLSKWRQATYMPSRVVRLKQLGAEVEFLECCDAHLAPLIDLAEAEQAAAETASRQPAAPQSTAPRVARWLRWMPWRSGGS